MPIVNSFSNGSARAFGWTSGPTVKPIIISATPGPSATVTTYSGYIVFKFNSSGTLNVGDGTPGTADVFLVAGGSNGETGVSAYPAPGQRAGGGGRGGRSLASPAVAITANIPLPVVVGGTGTNSTFGPITSASGSLGGAGGARKTLPQRDIFTPAVGNPGSAGPTNDYATGSPLNYSGGGGSGALVNSAFDVLGTYPGGSGGASGGGTGGGIKTSPPTASRYVQNGFNGSANTGGGGGGGAWNSGTHPPYPTAGLGGSGGSGVVIARFPDAQFATS